MPLDLTPALPEALLFAGALVLLLVGAFRGEGSARLLAPLASLLLVAVVVFTLLLASYQGAPVVLIILAVLLVAFGFLMRTTVLGRHVYAIGGNGPAARLPTSSPSAPSSPARTTCCCSRSGGGSPSCTAPRRPASSSSGAGAGRPRARSTCWIAAPACAPTRSKSRAFPRTASRL